MWINDGERESVGRDVKSVEFTVDCVVGGGAVMESERSTADNMCHSASTCSEILGESTGSKDGGSTVLNKYHPASRSSIFR